MTVEGSAGILLDPSNRKSKVEQLFSEPRPVAPFDKDHRRAALRCFDRETGLPVQYDHLKTYTDVLARYHLHPESKFENAGFTDAGITERRLIVATEIVHIGKEANRWEEQWHLGFDPTAEIIYGTAARDFSQMAASIVREARQFSRRALALASRLSAESGIAHSLWSRETY